MVSEYVIILMVAAAALWLTARRHLLSPRVFRPIVTGACLTICAELAFTRYVSVFGPANLVGHLFKLLSFFCLYKAVIETGLTSPYDLIFRDFRQREPSSRGQQIVVPTRGEDALPGASTDTPPAGRPVLPAIPFNTSYFLHTMLDSIQDQISIVDANSNILYLNDGMARAAGRNREEMLGKKCYEQYFGRGIPCEDCACAATRRTGERCQVTRWEEGRDGRRRFVERTGFPVKDVAGREVLCVIEFGRDVTQARRLEEANRDHRRELGRMLRELRRAYRETASLHDQLLQAEKLASVGEMGSSLAHELDSPLSTILGYAEMLADRPVGEQDADRLRIIIEQVGRCQQIIRSMLDFARRPSGEKGPVSLNTVVERVIALLDHALRAGKVKTQLDLQTPLAEVQADQEQIQQILFNLVKNAADAMPKGGVLRVRTLAADPQAVQLIVEDSGPGIPEDFLPRIFEPFFTTKPQGRGTGLGLPICRHIASQHGGKIGAENREEGGARFVLTLPVRQRDGDARPSTAEA